MRYSYEDFGAHDAVERALWLGPGEAAGLMLPHAEPAPARRGRAKKPAAPKAVRSADTVALRLIDGLREEILRRGPGALLGSEAEMLARFGVSRPTFRQIARLLEQEQLLVVKRGIGGGYYTRTPDVETVERTATNFLRAHGVSRAHILDAAGVINSALARRAALSDDAKKREALGALRDEMAAPGARAAGAEAFHRESERFRTAIAALAANPVLQLQAEILGRLAYADARDLPAAASARVHARLRSLRVRLADAILAREPEVAEALANVTTRTLNRWYESAAEE